MALAAIAAALSSTTPAGASYRWHPAGWWLSDALCIHHYEGSWTDPSAPYWGGMQMNDGFEWAYNPYWRRRAGHSNHWTIHAQLHAAYRAWRTRGWTPWPNTAAACGLL